MAINPQVTVAAKLAYAHHHGWALRRVDWSVPISEPESLCEGRLPETIDEAEMASKWSATEPMPGLTYSPDADGVVRHCTGSGRTRWEVRTDGSWFIWVCRPGDVAVIHVDGDAAGVIRVYARGAYYLRHVEALALALHAVAPTQAADLLASLLIRIPDDEALAGHERLARYTAERREYEPGYRGPAIASLLAARARRAAVRVLPGESLESFCARREAAS